jgi:tRNA pseudouridine55 synthase
MTPSYVVLEKKLGQTPLQAIDAWRLTHPEYKDTPATYAGRLDPMATGKLLVLLGEECKKQESYRGLDKEYEIEVLLDFSTDTGDVLGMPTYGSTETHPSVEQVRRVLRQETGTKTVPYPPFSSKTVNGKPLFLYALEGTLDTISIPSHKEKVYAISYAGQQKVRKEDLEKRITTIIAKAPRTNQPSKELGADFRQSEIGSTWHDAFSAMEDRVFTVLTLRVTCATGTYMRTLAQRLGKGLGTHGLALSIARTRVGRFSPFSGLGLWTRQFK